MSVDKLLRVAIFVVALIFQGGVIAAELTESKVLDFMKSYEAALETENFSEVSKLLHDDAIFRFSDGDYTGLNNIRTAFESTWARDVKENRYYISDVKVHNIQSDSATVIFHWNWSGISDEHGPFHILGRGTIQLIAAGEDIKLILEHLSR